MRFKISDPDFSGDGVICFYYLMSQSKPKVQMKRCLATDCRQNSQGFIICIQAEINSHTKNACFHDLKQSDQKRSSPTSYTNLYSHIIVSSYKRTAANFYNDRCACNRSSELLGVYQNSNYSLVPKPPGNETTPHLLGHLPNGYKACRKTLWGVKGYNLKSNRKMKLFMQYTH